MGIPKSKKLLWLFCGVLAMGASSAHADIRYLPILDLTYPVDSFGTFSGGAGLLAELELGSSFALESGAQYLGQAIKGDGVTTRFYSLQTPLSLRYIFSEQYSLGLGLYSELSFEGRALVYGSTIHFEYGVLANPDRSGLVLRLEHLRNLALSGVYNLLVFSVGYRF